MMVRARKRRIGSEEIRVAEPSDLVFMKLFAGRSRDEADIEALLTAHPDIDRMKLLRRFEELTHAIDMPELVPAAARLLGLANSP